MFDGGLIQLFLDIRKWGLGLKGPDYKGIHPHWMSKQPQQV